MKLVPTDAQDATQDIFWIKMEIVLLGQTRAEVVLELALKHTDAWNVTLKMVGITPDTTGLARKLTNLIKLKSQDLVLNFKLPI